MGSRDSLEIPFSYQESASPAPEFIALMELQACSTPVCQSEEAVTRRAVRQH
jgi:hypothetical protein